ncbi:HNH endonuclease [Ramlibacter tataouinensis]|uniref:HNH endonuclease n=1 Tax=Ramlibacter tataouinensis TaxID=94132 RepID=UPI0022F3EF44|nr:HNH endonuclease [Ramlibacter tataouinensis]WBY02787.1 HNH endonuclease [Ramlibacter tataouinensis]
MAREFPTVRDLLYWEYAKLIAGSATGSRAEYRFVSYTYGRLRAATANPSGIVLENKLLFKEGQVCAYCGARHSLEWDHVIPLAIGGPDTIDNLVRACRRCNASKGARDPYQWLLERPGSEVPRIVLGKLLKLLFEAYDRRGLLDSTDFMKAHAVQRTSLSKIFREVTGSGEASDPGVNVA